MATVKVRIAVLVDPKGNWVAGGSSTGDQDGIESVNACAEDLEKGDHLVWVEAEVPIPDVDIVVQGQAVLIVYEKNVL